VLATFCTPACNICTAPPVIPPTTAATPGTFIPHPSNNVYRAHTYDVLTNCPHEPAGGLTATHDGSYPLDSDHRVGGRPNAENSPGSRKTVNAATPPLPVSRTSIGCARRTPSAARRFAATAGLPVGGRWDEHHVAGSGEGAPGEESGHGVAPGEPDRQRRHLNTIVPCLACASSSTYGVSTPNSASQPRRRRVPGAADR
jgi:hypothetical protein